MTGAPYNSQSPPSQQPPFPVYSSPNKNHSHHPFYPPQTPPAFPHAALSRSPHYAHATPSMPTTLPPLNGGDSGSGMQHHSAGVHSSAPPPPFSLPRPYSASILSGNGASPYGHGHSTPSHAHPSPHPDGSLSQSPPRKDADPSYSRLGNGAPPGYSILREQPRPASPLKEAVRFFFFFFFGLSFLFFFSSRV